MKRLVNLLLYLPLLFVLAITASCVHEFPDDEALNPTKVNVELTLRLSPEPLDFYKTLVVSRSRAAVASVFATGGDDFVTPIRGGGRGGRRYIIEIYRAGQTDRPPVYSTTVYRDFSETDDLVVKVPLHAERYTVAVWYDYVDQAGGNRFYLVENLKRVHLPPPADYIGDTESKDCQSAVEDLDLTPYADQWNVSLQHVIPLSRPLAKIVFISTDLSKFIDKLVRRRAEQGGSRAVDSRTALNGYRAKIVYSGYLPSGFNVLTNKPNDSETGYSCFCGVELMDDGDVRLGFDYVLINTHATYVDAAIYVYDELGNEESHSDPIHIPIARNGITEVRDDFLTNTTTSGIGINPNFDGEFNIYY